MDDATFSINQPKISHIAILFTKYMKKILVILTFIVISIPAFSQSSWTPTIIEGEKTYSITSTDSKGNKCNILVFYNDYGLREAWFTMPGKIVEHEECLVPLGEHFVTHTTSYSLVFIENDKPKAIKLWGRDWSCIGNNQLDKKLETIISSTIVADAALGSAPFFDNIVNNQNPVILELPTKTEILVFIAPALNIRK